MRSIVIIGNCQANALAQRLQRAYSGIEDVKVEWTSSFREITPEKAETIRNAWMVCYQIAGFKDLDITSLYSGSSPIIEFPLLTVTALWPASSGKHPKDGPSENFRTGIFWGAQYCDDQANKIIAKGSPAQQSYDEYMSLNFASIYRLDRLYEMNKAKLSNLSEKTGFPAWFLYDNYLTSKRLHHTNMHPTNFMLDSIAEYLLDRIGLPASTKEKWQDQNESLNRQRVVIHKNGGNFNTTYQMPMHPDVVKHFGLNWYDDKNSFYFEGDIPFADYMWKYITLEVNYDIQSGVRNVAKANFEEGINLLEKGLEISTEAHNAWALLGKIYWATGKTPEAIYSLGRAAAIRPDREDYRQALDAVRGGRTAPHGSMSEDDVVFASGAFDAHSDNAVVID
jgi:tetratricopeptide (TPR) repeat protein